MDFYKSHSRWTHCVHHKDKNPLNNNMDNLEIVTIYEHRKIHSNRAKQILPNGDCPYCFRKTIENKCLCGRKLIPLACQLQLLK